MLNMWYTTSLTSHFCYCRTGTTMEIQVRISEANLRYLKRHTKKFNKFFKNPEMLHSKFRSIMQYVVYHIANIPLFIIIMAAGQ
jgi:hypothetical protein